MRVLGIETSCDETAICLIEAEGDFDADFRFRILGNALLSQIEVHRPYGGVFPNLAKREHSRNLVPILTAALQEAHALHSRVTDTSVETGELKEMLAREPELFEQLSEFLTKYEKPAIDCIAVTVGPGLEPALWVGVNFAKALRTAWSASWRMPIVGVNHMEGHIVVSAMGGEGGGQLAVGSWQKMHTFEFPMLSLLISGGHTELVLSRAWMQYELVGQTRDDAVGEAFDKVARLLGLPYPGGPEISRLARAAREANTPRTLELPRPMTHETSFDFSFAGLKTAVRRAIEARGKLRDDAKMEIAREFEDAAADVLVAKTIAAADEYSVKTIVVGGGVSANAEIRQRLSERIGSGAKVLMSPPALATDNALMIALAGYFHALKKEFADTSALRAQGTLRLAQKTIAH